MALSIVQTELIWQALCVPFACLDFIAIQEVGVSRATRIPLYAKNVQILHQVPS
jgi:hypothetical protein